MPLLIDFKSGDKLIINGAVVENAGASSKLLVHNRVSILRGREVLSEEDAVTPASRIYFALQCAYIFPEKSADYISRFEQFLGEYEAACPSAAGLASDARAAVSKGHLYKGLKAVQKIIHHEHDLLRSLKDDAAQIVGEIIKGMDGDSMQGGREE